MSGRPRGYSSSAVLDRWKLSYLVGDRAVRELAIGKMDVRYSSSEEDPDKIWCTEIYTGAICVDLLIVAVIHVARRRNQTCNRDCEYPGTGEIQGEEMSQRAFYPEKASDVAAVDRRVVLSRSGDIVSILGTFEQLHNAVRVRAGTFTSIVEIWC